MSQLHKFLEQYQRFTFTVIGWFLGFISSQIQQFIERNRLREEFKKTLCTELKEMTTRLVGNYVVLENPSILFNRENLAWLDSMSPAYSGDLSEEIKALLKINNELDRLAKLEQKHRSMFIPKFYLPFLEENISSLALLDNSPLQASVLAIRRNIGWLNENIMRCNFYFEKSFDQSLSETNREIIISNMSESHKQMATLCKKTADLCKTTILKFDQ